MSKKTLLAFGGSMVVVVVALAEWGYYAAHAPIDDPSFFCHTPDPAPVTSMGSTITLQDCAAGKTFKLNKGQTVAVDLFGFVGTDTSEEWTDLVVSDGQVLSTDSAPARVTVRRAGAGDEAPRRVDEVAVYRAARTGQATINAMVWGTPITDFNDRRHVWGVTILVE